MHVADKAELERMRKWPEQTVSAAHMHRRVELERADAWQEAMTYRRMLGSKTKEDEAEAQRRWDELGPRWHELARLDSHLDTVLRHYYVLMGAPLWWAVQFFRYAAVTLAQCARYPQVEDVPEFIADPREPLLLQQAEVYCAIRARVYEETNEAKG